MAPRAGMAASESLSSSARKFATCFSARCGTRFARLSGAVTHAQADVREMTVADIMQADVVTVTPTTPLIEAARLARGRRIRHLPVLEDGRLVGIISDRELRLARPSPATDTVPARELLELLNRLTVGALMRRIVVTVPRDASIAEAAQLMIDHKIGALAVTEKRALIGIVTEIDLLKLLAKPAR